MWIDILLFSAWSNLEEEVQLDKWIPPYDLGDLFALVFILFLIVILSSYCVCV